MSRFRLPLTYSSVNRLNPAFFLLLVGRLANGAEVENGYQGKDWPGFRGVHRDGISHETGWVTDWPKGGLQRLWKRNVGAGYSAVSVVGDRAYTMGRKGDEDVVYCLSTDTGRILWEHSYPAKDFNLNHDGGPASTPTVEEGRVYTLSRNGHVHCFDAKDGKVIWDIKVTDVLQIQPHVFGYVTSPLVDGDRLIIDLGMVLALDKKTTQMIWNSEPYTPSYGSPVRIDLGGKPLLLCFNEFGPTVLDRNTGKELAKTRWETWSGINAVTPIVSENRFFISSGYRTGGAVYEIPKAILEPAEDSEIKSNGHINEATATDGGDLPLIWRNQVLSNHYTTCVLWEDHLYGYDEDTIKCVEFKSGIEKWGKSGFGKGALTLADGKLLILSERGELYLARATPEGFDGLGFDHVLGGTCWTAPVLSHGRIYCRNSKGDIVCLDVRPNQDK